jgi:GNAT superfamily N-acetyltransferase
LQFIASPSLILTMPRLVPPNCVMRPSQIQDLRRLAELDRQLAHIHHADRASRWRNFAALAFLSFSLFVALKDLKLLAMLLLGFAPIYFILGWLGWLTWHPPLTDWVDYWVVECEQTIIACAKWRHYDSYSHLVSLYVDRRWRQHGIGSSLVERLTGQTLQPIYVLSDHTGVEFYARFGFQPIAWDELPENFPHAEFPIPGIAAADRDQPVPLKLIPTPLRSKRLGDFWEEVRQKMANLTFDPIEHPRDTPVKETFTLEALTLDVTPPEE